MAQTFVGSGPIGKLVALGPLLTITGVVVSKAQSSVLGLSTDLWGGFLLALGLTITSIWIAQTVRELLEGRRR